MTRTPGTVYWTATARYYDNRETLEQTGSRKLALSRKYFTLTPVQKNGRIVYRDTPFTGTLGARRSAARAAHRGRIEGLALPDARGSASRRHGGRCRKPISTSSNGRRHWWYGSKREYRDNRVVQFQTDFSRGRYEYIYLLKAVIPGRFRAMPARLAPMYAPGVAATTAPQPVEIRVGRRRATAPGGSR